METIERSRGKGKPVLISTLSTAVAMGLAYVVYNRRGKDETEANNMLKAPAEHKFNLKNLLPFQNRRRDVYNDDSDIGYC